MASISGREGASLCLALFSIACSSGTIPGAVDGGVTQFTVEEVIGSEHAVLVLVVDDGPSAESEAIRSAMGRALPSTLLHLIGGNASGLDVDWARSDLRIVVVHPSVAGSAALVGPSDDADLALVTDNATDGAITAAVGATTRAIGAATTPSLAPYALLEAARRTVDLVTHARAPADAHEAAVISSLGEPDSVALVLATARDDASPVDSAAAGWWSGTTRPDWYAPVTVLSSLSTGPDLCQPTLDPSTRLGAWVQTAREAGTRMGAVVVSPSCDEDPAGSKLLEPAVIGDSQLSCLPAAVAADPDGRLLCRVVVTMDDDAPCAAHSGMLDPRDPDGIRRPRVDKAGLAGRVCEIQQLTGAPAVACSTTDDCSGCAAGWCVRTLPSSSRCPHFRFVHGAVPRGHASLEVVCDIVP